MREQVCCCKHLRTDKASFVGEWRKVNSIFVSACVWLCVAESEVIKLWYCAGELGFLDALGEIGSRLLLEELLLKSIRLTRKDHSKGMQAFSPKGSVRKKLRDSYASAGVHLGKAKGN